MNNYRSIITALILTIGINSFAQNSVLDQFFSKYHDDPAFSVVNISPRMFEMLAGADIESEDDDEVTDLIKSITGLRILIKDEGDGTALFEDAFSKVSKNGFEELLTVRDKGENIRFMIREGSTDNIIDQLVLLVGGKENFVLLDLTGKINLKTVGKLSKSLNVPGAEHLEKIDKQ